MALVSASLTVAHKGVWYWTRLTFNKGIRIVVCIPYNKGLYWNYYGPYTLLGLYRTRSGTPSQGSRSAEGAVSESLSHIRAEPSRRRPPRVAWAWKKTSPDEPDAGEKHHNQQPTEQEENKHPEKPNQCPYYIKPYYTILYYTILYYTILYYTILYYTILYYTIQYNTILYSTLLYSTLLYSTLLCSTLLYSTLLYSTLLYTILYYTILYYTILYYTILYYTILYYTILYYTILYYTILYYNIRHQQVIPLPGLRQATNNLLDKSQLYCNCQSRWTKRNCCSVCPTTRKRINSRYTYSPYCLVYLAIVVTYLNKASSWTTGP